MKSTYRSTVPASGGLMAICELRWEVRAEPWDAARASLPDKPGHQQLLCGSQQGGGTRGGTDAVGIDAHSSPLPVPAAKVSLWALFFLPTHTWQTEPISSACLKLRLQEHEKGHCPPGWVAAEMKPSERQRPNQQQFCGQLAGSAKPELLALQQGSCSSFPAHLECRGQPDHNSHLQSRRSDSSGAAEMPLPEPALRFLQSKQHFILLTQIGGALGVCRTPFFAHPHVTWADNSSTN